MSGAAARRGAAVAELGSRCVQSVLRRPDRSHPRCLTRRGRLQPRPCERAGLRRYEIPDGLHRTRSSVLALLNGPLPDRAALLRGGRSTHRSLVIAVGERLRRALRARDAPGRTAVRHRDAAVGDDVRAPTACATRDFAVPPLVELKICHKGQDECSLASGRSCGCAVDFATSPRSAAAARWSRTSPDSGPARAPCPLTTSLVRQPVRPRRQAGYAGRFRDGAGTDEPKRIGLPSQGRRDAFG